ncbi:MAG: hypothetical protein Q3998_01800 [Porphyromonas sp.]|nr:hypothetical protein [Porphyromonas sp.]
MNATKKLQITGYIGLLGSLIMFTGDMLLYFTTEPFNDISKEFLPSMGSVPPARMYAGGLVGPLAAFCLMIGFYHLYLSVKVPRKTVAKLMLLLLSVAIVMGGAYHALFPTFGVVARQGHPELVPLLFEYAKCLGLGLAISIGLGWLIFCYLVLRKQTIYPRWIIVATPLISLWFGILWEHLPQPFLIVIAGGWNSLVLTIFFAVSLIVLRNKKID